MMKMWAVCYNGNEIMDVCQSFECAEAVIEKEYKYNYDGNLYSVKQVTVTVDEKEKGA